MTEIMASMNIKVRLQDDNVNTVSTGLSSTGWKHSSRIITELDVSGHCCPLEFYSLVL
jgi:hypothetical protein